MFAVLALIAFILALFHVTLGSVDLVVVGLALLACHFIWGEPWFTSFRGRRVR